ncbi:MAG: SDR family NAD(P)-dependent oxidoreductase [Acidimicrobiales bacterium]
MTEPAIGALVLGGHGAIGTAITTRFEAAGYDVVATGRKDLDLTDAESINRWFERSHPPLGVLVHSAGINFPKPFMELSEDEIAATYETNVSGFLRVTRLAIPDLVAAKGRVVVISSIFGFLSRVGRLPYSASKHALVGIVKSLALELAPDGVLVNAVSPGYIDTRLTWQNNDAETVHRLESAIPMRRMGTATEVAEVVYFLGSRQNGYVTGQDVVVDGGLSVDGGRG